MKNMDLWNKLCTTPPEVTSPYTSVNGVELTAVDPIYRAKKMTETFGPAGIGWGWDVAREWDMECGGYRYVYAKVQVWYCDQEGVMRYVGPQIGGSPCSDPAEAFKSAITDGIGKCLSMLGLAADVYSGGHATKTESSTTGKMAESIAKALKIHAEGDKNAIENACEAIRRSSKYTEREKAVVIHALSSGNTGELQA